jgi:hypothetical protein
LKCLSHVKRYSGCGGRRVRHLCGHHPC